SKPLRGVGIAATMVGTIGLAPVRFEMRPTLRVARSLLPPHQASRGPTVAVVADGSIHLQLAEGARMHGAPHVGSKPEHDWLIVGSSGPAPASDRAAEKLGASAQNRVAVSGAIARQLWHACCGILRRARAAASAGFAHCGSAIERFLLRVGKGARGGEARGRTLKACRAHPLASLFAVVAILCLGYVVYCMATVPLDGGLTIEPTPSALVVEADGGQVFATRGIFKGDKLAAQDVLSNLSQAIIAIEDRHFYEHTGFYLPSIMRAAYRNLVSGSAREGGSTITQQLARMTYLSQERTIRRKIQEAVLTYWLEHALSKHEILTRYLNTAYFGAGVYGVDAAAKRYFGKAAKELSLSEAAMLAGLVRAPSALAPTRNLEG